MFQQKKPAIFQQRQPLHPRKLQVPAGQVAKVILDDASVVEVESTSKAYEMPKGSRLMSIGPPEQSGIQEIQP